LLRTGDEGISFVGVRDEPRAVDCKESIRGGESRALVAIDERTVLREALPERAGLLDEIGVITGLRPVKAGFQQPLVPVP
jgi:hypothetical protein